MTARTAGASFTDAVASAADHFRLSALASPQIAGLANPVKRRIPALDGFGGLMTIAVVVSHFFAEIQHGGVARTTGTEKKFKCEFHPGEFNGPPPVPA